MKPNTYYSRHREERLAYQNKHKTFCSICKNSYRNKESHFRNPKYVIIHQQYLSDALKTAK